MDMIFHNIMLLTRQQKLVGKANLRSKLEVAQIEHLDMGHMSYKGLTKAKNLAPPRMWVTDSEMRLVTT
jgi:hypothetical protein